jgi:hypothetical protein
MTAVFVAEMNRRQHAVRRSAAGLRIRQLVRRITNILFRIPSEEL